MPVVTHKFWYSLHIFCKWWPTRCNFWFVYLYPNSCTCFGRCFRPSSGALDWFTASDIVHRYCCRPVSWTRWNLFNLVHDTGRPQHRWTISEAVSTVKCFWWWVKTSPETCRVDWVQINKPKVASCWSSVTNYANDVRTHKHQNLILTV